MSTAKNHSRWYKGGATYNGGKKTEGKHIGTSVSVK